MLDEGDATHTKPIENYFGNIDRELAKAGPQGFGKVSDDLVIKYAKDVVVGDFKWRTKANTQTAKTLKMKENDFNKKQKELLSKKVDESDALKLTQNNQILRCIDSCKKAHQGPVTSIDELKQLVADWSSTEKSLHTSLNMEIRLRKLTFTNVKASCPLFQQRYLTIEQKTQNLESLIGTQLEMSASATMSDLEDAILNCDANEVQMPPDLNDESNDQEESLWPPNNGECIVCLFTDGPYPGEVIQVDGDFVEADFFMPVTNLQGMIRGVT